MRRYFRFVKKKIVAALLTLSLTIGSVAFAAMPEIMKLNDVKAGMHGTAYTVIDPSNELMPIDVDIVSVMGDAKLDNARILAKLSGETIEKTGGILSGMSGSPVYIDGKLIGALSANFKEVYMNNAIITPIESMLKIWNMPDRKNKTQLKQINLKQYQEDRDKDEAYLESRIAEIQKELDKLKASASADKKKTDKTTAASKDNTAKKTDASKEKSTMAAANKKDKTTVPSEKSKAKSDSNAKKTGSKTVQERAVLNAYGFGERGFSYLKESLDKYGIRAMDGKSINAGENKKVRTGVKLRPGDPMGVVAVIGDFSIGAFGTVTAVDGDRVVGFGHPFSHRGNVNYFLTGSRVLATVNGPLNGMKLAEVDGIIGRVNQDRSAGVAGIVGTFPQNVPVIVTVHDKDLGTVQTYRSVVAYDEEVLTELVSGVTYASIDKAVDRLNDSTASLKFAIRTNVGEKGKLERRNMYYDAKDVGKLAVSELKDFMTAISANKERESDITEVRVDVVVDPKRQTASLISAVPSKQKVEPGETITFKTTLKPYREEKIIFDVPFTVPKGQPSGQLKLDMHGGGLVNVTKALLAQQAQAIAAAKADATKEEDVTQTTEELLKEAVDMPHNNDIVIEASVKVITSDEEQAEAIKEAKKQAKLLRERAKKAAANAKNKKSAGKAKDAKNASPKAKRAKLPKFPTSFIIDNVIRTSITVVEPDPEKTAEKIKNGAPAKPIRFGGTLAKSSDKADLTKAFSGKKKAEIGTRKTPKDKAEEEAKKPVADKKAKEK